MSEAKAKGARGPHRVRRINIDGLWGDRSFDLTTYPDLTILIGPNASGKTTILNLLHHALTGDVLSLLRSKFKSITVELEPFIGGKNINCRVTRTDDAIEWTVGNERFAFPAEEFLFSRHPSRAYQRARVAHLEGSKRGLVSRLREIVPAAWLPVSRRLPITSDIERSLHDVETLTHLESVDHRLKELAEALGKYRLRLDARLAQDYKKFERDVLGLILHDDTNDTLNPRRKLEPLKPDEKAKMVKAFREAGLLDANLEQRIDRHFRAAAAAMERIRSSREPSFEDVLMLPLIWRTKETVRLAQDLENRRDEIFASLNRFKNIVDEFLKPKQVLVENDGSVSVSREGQGRLPLEALSSGEKQILILLTQALLFADEPAVYVADEPELSLHVKWQETLLRSLLDLGGEIQIIVATHSPDIVSIHRDRVVNLGAL